MKDFTVSSSGIHFEDWGLIDYEAAVMGQLELLQRLSEGKAMETVIFCSHQPIVTLGRATQPGDVFGWQGKTLEVTRGGRATYHGPSQIVMYAILDLNRSHHQRAPKEIVGFLRDFENCIVEALQEFGIKAQGKSLQKFFKPHGADLEKPTQTESLNKPDKPTGADLQKNDPLDLEETGVWVGKQKVASLGIAVKKWITYHGAALNLDEDPEAFQGMKPCGFNSSTMVSVEKILGKKVSREKMISVLKEKSLKYL